MNEVRERVLKSCVVVERWIRKECEKRQPAPDQVRDEFKRVLLFKRIKNGDPAESLYNFAVRMLAKHDRTVTV